MFLLLFLCLEKQTRTDGVDEVVEELEGEERLGQLPEEHLQGSCGDVDVLPLPLYQVHLLVWTHTHTHTLRCMIDSPAVTTT